MLSVKPAAAFAGLYDLVSIEGQASVFGKSPEWRLDASPLFDVRVSAPPFLVTYCQWDYASLPPQARAFHAALQTTGVPSELLYVPGENHISQMVHVPNRDDPTAAAILKMLKGGAASGGQRRLQ